MVVRQNCCSSSHLKSIKLALERWKRLWTKSWINTHTALTVGRILFLNFYIYYILIFTLTLWEGNIISPDDVDAGSKYVTAKV